MSHWVACCCGDPTGGGVYYIFEPCEDDCLSFQMAAEITVWRDLLGLPQIDPGDPSTIDTSGVWLFTPDPIDCCREPDADPEYCGRFCGTLRLVTEGEITKFCEEATTCPACPPTGLVQLLDPSFDAGTFTRLDPEYDCGTAPCTGCRPIQCEEDTFLKVTSVRTYRLHIESDVEAGGTVYSKVWIPDNSNCERRDRFSGVQAEFNLEFSVEYEAYLRVNVEKRDYLDPIPPDPWDAAILSKHKECTSDCINIKTVTILNNDFSSSGNILTEVLPSGGVWTDIVEFNWAISGSLGIENISIPRVEVRKVEALYEDTFGDYNPPSNPQPICGGEDGRCQMTYFAPMSFDVVPTGSATVDETNWSVTGCGGFNGSFSDSWSVETLVNGLTFPGDVGKVAFPAEEYCCCSQSPSASLVLKTLQEANRVGFGGTGSNPYSLTTQLLDPANYSYDVSFSFPGSLAPWDWDTLGANNIGGTFELFKIFNAGSHPFIPSFLDKGTEGYAYIDEDEQETRYDCDVMTGASNFNRSFTLQGLGSAVGDQYDEIRKELRFNMTISDTITGWECVEQADIPAGCNC